MESLKGKVAIITGASSGIGRATALYFAKLGCRLVLVARNEDNLKVTRDGCIENGLTSEQVVNVVADVTKEESRTEVIDKTVSTFGKLHILVNNAGTMSKCDQSVYTLTEAGLDTQMDVNVKAPLFLSRQAIPHLKETKGCIVNVSSLYSKEITNTLIGYHMTKAALDMMTKILAKDLVTHGVRVNSVNPGFVQTSFHKNLDLSDEVLDQIVVAMREQNRQPLGIGQPEDISKMVAMLASDISSHMTGENLFACGNVAP